MEASDGAPRILRRKGREGGTRRNGEVSPASGRDQRDDALVRSVHPSLPTGWFSTNGCPVLSQPDHLPQMAAPGSARSSTHRAEKVPRVLARSDPVESTTYV
ncbi:MAG: hypothetical protein M1823_000550 [Watsoniomyces obsoletus]|nr:MAG: hypothetical protein M1823_000550 [Watsoniomyces obsoletus]